MSICRKCFAAAEHFFVGDDSYNAMFGRVSSTFVSQPILSSVYRPKTLVQLVLRSLATHWYKDVIAIPALRVTAAMRDCVTALSKSKSKDLTIRVGAFSSISDKRRP